MRTRIGIEALFGGNFTGLQQRLLLVGLELEDFLVERTGLGEESLLAQAVGNPEELLDGLVASARADVQVAQHVGGIPVPRIVFDHPHVLRDRGVDLAQPQQFFCIPERRRAVDGHWGLNQSIVSNSVGGRNERRCASE